MLNYSFLCSISILITMALNVYQVGYFSLLHSIFFLRCFFLSFNLNHIPLSSYLVSLSLSIKLSEAAALPRLAVVPSVGAPLCVCVCPGAEMGSLDLK